MKRFLHDITGIVVALFFAIAVIAAGIAVPPASAQMQGGPVQNGTPVSPSVTGSDLTSGIYFGPNRTGVSGHLESGTGAGDVPTVTTCGTTPTPFVGNTDMQGSITLGTTASGCIITFGTPYSQQPSCIVTWRATPLAVQSYAVSTTAITLTQTSTSNNVIDYVCIAKSLG